MRGFLTAAGVATAVLMTAAAGTGMIPPAWADGQCTGQQGPNPGKPETYRDNYSSIVATALKRDLAEYQSAVDSGDPHKIGTAATSLYGEMQTDTLTFGTQKFLGCYDPGVLTDVEQATDAFGSTLDDISGAAAGFSGKTPDDVPALVAQGQPQEKAYVAALNKYSDQFGGEQLAQP